MTKTATPDDERKPLRLSALAQSLGVSEKTLRRYVDAGCPHHKGPGRSGMYTFDRDEVVSWMEAVGRDGVQGGSPDELNTLVKRANLAIKNLEVTKRKRLEAAARGELLDARDVETGRLERIALVRQGLLSMPGKLAPRLVGREVAEIQREIEREVSAMLDQFAAQFGSLA